MFTKKKDFVLGFKDIFSIKFFSYVFTVIFEKITKRLTYLNEGKLKI